MFQLLLIIIYIAFISLGLPDSLLGSAWPSMYGELNVPVSFAGIISMIIAGGTILSSLFSDRLIRKFGTGLVTVLSVAMTAVALTGFSSSHVFWKLCLWGIPYGLGAGSVDAALNNYVAIHYKSRHMSWLHCFWGIGATAGPYIMGLCLTRGLKWNAGYHSIGVIQIVLVILLTISLPLWGAQKGSGAGNAVQYEPIGIRDAVKLPGAKAILTAFFCYCSLEATAGLWAGSYMALYRGIHAETAAKWAALFYLGITAGRFICGLIADRFGDKYMVRLGQLFTAFGVMFLLLPLGNTVVLIGLILTGTGCAPIFPSLLHATPDNFSAKYSQSLMGMQMACAYVGTTFMPPLFGLIAQLSGVWLYPVYLLLFVAGMSVMTEKMNRIRNHKGHSDEGTNSHEK